MFTHRAGSRYDDFPERQYHFPSTYLRRAEAALGDWIVYYEPRRDGGRQVYFATARLDRIVADPVLDGHYFGFVSEYLEFPFPVPVREGEAFFESMLRKDDGTASKGAFGRSIRTVPDAEFDAILRRGITAEPDPWERAAEMTEGFAEPAQTPFSGPEDGITPRPMIESLTRRRFRDAAFSRQVRAAYGYRCAMTGLAIRNGGGRPEVQAAHIRPVAEDGPDTVRNGLALSGTVHWMFDRGLVSVDGDGRTILVARDRLPDTAERLIVPDRTLLLPAMAQAQPHRAYLEWHRETVFKG